MFVDGFQWFGRDRCLMFNGCYLMCIDVQSLSPSQLLTVDRSFAAKDYMNINTKFHGAAADEVGGESRPILPFEGEFCPGELGKLFPALELASDHSE